MWGEVWKSDLVSEKFIENSGKEKPAKDHFNAGFSRVLVFVRLFGVVKAAGEID